MEYIDTHAHLDGFIADGTLDDVLNRAKLAGVTRIISCSTNVRDWRLYSSLAVERPDIISWQIGIHPEELSEGDDLALDGLSCYFSDVVAPVAVGEIGLDYYRLPTDAEEAKKEKDSQLKIFRRQLVIARDLDVPVCVHARNSVEECIEEVAASGVDFAKTVFHCFSGTEEQIRRLNELGGRGSFTGIITYKSASEMREAMAEQGLGMLMLETDSPYLAPVPNRGKTCESAMISDTARAAAEVFGVGLDYISDVTTRNAREFFGLK